MRPYLAAIGSALLMWAAFPPLDWGLLAFVAPVLLLAALRKAERALHAAVIGFLYGFVFFGLLLNYVRFVGFVAWVPLTTWLAATAAGYGLIVWTFRLWPARRWWFIVVGGWGLWELVRERFPFGGFPWGGLGYGVGGNPGLIGAVQWIGPSGWTVLAVAVAAGLVLLLEDRMNWRLFVDPLVVVLLLALAGGLAASRPRGPTLRTAIIQGNSPCPQVHCQNENERIYESHLALTQSLGDGSVEFVVWPENAASSPFDPETNEEVRQAIIAEAERLGAYILVSGTRTVGDDGFLNVNAVFAPTGDRIGEYAKRHPVPFGEYVPLRGLLDFIPQLDQVPRDMVRGSRAVVFRLPEGIVGSVISFEGAFLRDIRPEVDAGAQIMVVATNESTWGAAPASDQLIGLTRVNAAAIGQDVIHAAITGKSAFISADGSVTATTDLLTTEVLIGDARFRSGGKTIYVRFGDWVLLAALAAALAAVAVPGEGRPERRRDPW